jgi:predicted transcriptional regulator
LHPKPHPSYYRTMAEAKKHDWEGREPVRDDEDEQTLGAIDEGVRDADAGRTVPLDEVRRRLPQWITGSSSRKEH